jgi:hypothetical protein
VLSRDPIPTTPKKKKEAMNLKDLDWTAITTQLSSHKAQLVFAAVASGFAVGSTILALQSARQIQKLQDIKKSIRSRDEATAVRPFPLRLYTHN